MVRPFDEFGKQLDPLDAYLGRKCAGCSAQLMPHVTAIKLHSCALSAVQVVGNQTCLDRSNPSGERNTGSGTIYLSVVHLGGIPSIDQPTKGVKGPFMGVLTDSVRHLRLSVWAPKPSSTSRCRLRHPGRVTSKQDETMASKANQRMRIQ